MSFNKRSMQDRSGRKPPQKPAAAEKPMRMPPLVDERPPARNAAVSGYEQTLAVSSHELDTRQSGARQRSETPTAQRQAPPPIPVARTPPVPVASSEEPSELMSALTGFHSRLQELESVPGEQRINKLRALLQEVQNIRRENAERSDVRKADLEHLNAFIAMVNNKVIEVVDMMQVHAVRTDAERQPIPPPLPIQSATPSMQMPSVAVQQSIPLQAAPAPQADAAPGASRRFITSPMTWAVASISAFTAVLFQQDAFRAIAETVGRMLKSDPPSAKMTAIVYGAVVAVSLAVTSVINLLRNRSAERKEAQQLRQQNPGPTIMGPDRQ